jgi:hypothetical protein
MQYSCREVTEDPLSTCDAKKDGRITDNGVVAGRGKARHVLPFLYLSLSLGRQRRYEVAALSHLSGWDDAYQSNKSFGQTVKKTVM